MTDGVKPTNALTFPPSSLGPALVGEAAERYNESRLAAVSADIQRLMAGRDESLRQERHWALSAEWFRKKLAAINAGEFTFDELRGAIVMNDPDLQRANY
ncbi:MAG TPA: hypothetical protein VJX23_03055 [Candidatus Binataceae bacterium]|nr:hypothetical protein [Candidatus Binataceae bacterium]